MNFTQLQKLLTTSENDTGRKSTSKQAQNLIESIPAKVHELELQQTLNELKIIVENNKASENDAVLSPSLVQDLKNYLKVRDARVTCYGIGYMAMPQSIANLLCKNIALGILQQQGISEWPNRDLYQLLMSSLNITGTVSLYKNIQTEPCDLPEYGTFLLSDVLLKTGTGPVISFKEMMQACSMHLFYLAYILHSTQKAEIIRNHKKYNKRLKQIEMNPQASLTMNEKERFINFNSAAKEYLFKQELQLKAILNDATLKNHLEALALGLYDGGAGKKGSEYNAGAPASEAIAIFMDFFNSLSKEVQKQLRLLKGIGNPRSLGEILDIIREPPDVNLSSASCTNANSGILATIVSNPANAILLNTKIENLIQNETLNLEYDFTPAAIQGRDLINAYPFEVLSLLFFEITTWAHCIKFINYCQIKAENKHELSTLAETFHQFYKQQPDKLPDRLNDIEQPEWISLIYKQIKSDLPSNWTFTGFRLLLLKLPPQEIEDELLRLADASPSVIGNVKTLNELLNYFQEEQADTICQFINTFKTFKINNINELNQILKHRTPKQSAYIFSFLESKQVLQRHIRTVHDLRSVLTGVTSQTIAAIIKHISIHALVKTWTDIKVVFDMTQIDQNTCLLVAAPLKPLLLTFTTDLNVFLRFMSNFIQKTQVVISELLKNELLAMIKSVVAFRLICISMGSATQDFVYQQLRVQGLCLLITNLDEFYSMMSLLKAWQRIEVYDAFKMHLFSLVNTANDFHKALYFLPESCRSDFLKNTKQKLFNCFELRLLKFFTKDEAYEIICECITKQWHLTQPSLPRCFYEILNLIPDGRKSEMYQMIGPENLKGAIKTAEDYYHVAVLLPAQTQYELYEQMQDSLPALLKTPQDFKHILDVTPIEKVPDFFILCRPFLLTLFATPDLLKSLDSNQPQCQKFIACLCELLELRFIPIYHALRNVQPGLLKTNYAQDNGFLQSNGWARCYHLWTHITTEKHRNGRAHQALELALQLCSDLELVQAIYDKSILTHSWLSLFSQNEVLGNAVTRQPARMQLIQNSLKNGPL